MRSRLLAPRWLAAHAALIAALVVCGLLGWWQLDRARDQHAQSMLPALNAAAEPVPLDSLLTASDRLSLSDVGRSVTVTGAYDAANQLLVPGIELEGKTGYAVLTPLVNDGPALLVLRGWVEANSDEPSAVPAPPTGEVTVTGRLGAGEPPPPLDEVLPAGQIGSVHLASLVNLVPYPLYDAVLSRTAESPAPAEALAALPPPDLAAGGSWPLQNVFYAIEWWVFGLATVALWVSAVRRRDEPPPASATKVTTPAA